MEVEGDWTDENILQLVEDVRKHRCIWDPMDMNHRRKRKKQEVYFVLAAKYKCSPEEVARKWANLLQTFRNLRRKMTIKCGLGVDEYRPRWFAFEQINNFMQHVYTPRGITDMPIPMGNSESNEDYPDDDDTRDYKVFEGMRDDEFSIQGEELSQSPAHQGENKRENLPPQQSVFAKRQRTTESDVVYESNSVPSLQDRVAMTSHRLYPGASEDITNDCYEHFGRYIASMLRTIGPPEAVMLQQEITVLVTNRMCSAANRQFLTNHRPQ